MISAISERGFKAAATRIGVSLKEYCEHIEAGEAWCSMGRQWHPRSDFQPSNRSTGLQGSCRSAMLAYSYAWRDAHRERYLARQDRYYKARRPGQGRTGTEAQP